LRFGVCTWVFGGASLVQAAAKIASIGCDGLELMGDLSAYRPAEVRSVCEGTGLSVLSLTPENEDLAHPDEAVRQKALDYYRRLIEFAHEIDCPLVSCHGAVGRVRAISSQDVEYNYLRESVAALAETAQAARIKIAMEVLNRYESHLLNTAAQALRFVQAIDHSSIGILLDAYHMNIEEANPARAVESAGDHLFIFHVADSNRAGVGRGHTDFAALAAALKRIGYAGDVIVECTASGPDPFTPVKGTGWQAELETYLAESLAYMRRNFAPSH
jgi:D-psicose/D-tagatose/L-ribulose 3-epimerase